MGEERWVAAVDVGGTDLKSGLIRRAEGPIGYELAAVNTAPTRADEGPEALVARLADMITRHHPAPRAYGVVVPGIVSGGVAHRAVNIGFIDYPLRERLTELTGLPGIVDHDVRAAGLAEWRTGPFADARNLLFLPLGTGTPAALVVDGRPLVADGYAGELGHVAVQAAAGRACPCGQVGCLERVSSAAGVRRSYVELAGLAEAEAPATVDIADLARAGDHAARQAFVLAVDGLTEALVLAASVLGPEVVVLGGGLAGAHDLLVEPLRAALTERLTFQRGPAIELAHLGSRAGLIGAGLLALEGVDL